MNHFMQEKWPIGRHPRDAHPVLDTLLDADLAFSPGGTNMTLGALCREMAKSSTTIPVIQDPQAGLELPNTDPGSKQRRQAQRHRSPSFDAEMKATLDAMSDDDLKKNIMRDSGYEAPRISDGRLPSGAADFLRQATDFSQRP